MTRSQNPIRVAGPAETLAVIATSLGYTPANSLVALSIREGGRVGLVCRIDLVDVDASAIASITQHLLRDEARRVVVVAYGEDAERDTRLAIRMGAVVQARGMTLDAWVRVSADGYRVDGENTPHPLSDIESTQTAATFVFNGGVVRGSLMQTLPGRVAPTQQRAAAAAHAQWLTLDEAERMEGALHGWRRAVAGESSPELYGQIAAALTHILTRDAVLISLIPGTSPSVVDALVSGPLEAKDESSIGAAIAKIVDPVAGIRPAAEAETAAEILAQVIAHIEDSPAAWTLWGLIAWWTGQGAQSAASVRKALSLDERYRLALLLNQAIEAGMAPGWVNAR